MVLTRWARPLLDKSYSWPAARSCHPLCPQVLQGLAGGRGRALRDNPALSCMSRSWRRPGCCQDSSIRWLLPAQEPHDGGCWAQTEGAVGSQPALPRVCFWVPGLAAQRGPTSARNQGWGWEPNAPVAPEWFVCSLPLSPSLLRQGVGGWISLRFAVQQGWWY